MATYKGKSVSLNKPRRIAKGETSYGKKKSVVYVKDGDGRRMEYYSSEDSPTGEEMIDIFDPALQGEELQNAIVGEFLHSAPTRSKEYAELRDVLQSIKTPQQNQDDISRYEYAKENYGESRPFEKWLDVSGLDAFIRGYAVGQWEPEYYTDEQKIVIDMMMDIVKEK
jgi:hypothetical protein